MKYKIDIVSGLNYGDEGKGLVTNALSDENTLIVFASNSAQRSHTVVDGEKRHAFRCFGSGTFKGAATYYSEGYMPNPSLFREEWNELQLMGITPKVFINSGCLWVTPMDMYYNMMMSRGKTNTTGCGVWSAICRNKNLEYNFPMSYKGTINKNRDENFIKKNLSLIKQYYSQNVYEDIDTWFFNGDYLISNIIDDFHFMLNHCTIIENIPRTVIDFLHNYSHIIFENSQGLLLDEDYSMDAKYSTPASVGCKEPCSLIKRYFKETNVDLSAFYVTRTYLTRHGDGPMVGIECPSTSIYPDLVDKTNIFNTFQGSIRYGYFTESTIEDMKKRLNKDFDWCKSVTEAAKANIVITHKNILNTDSRWNTIIRDSKIKTFVSDNEVDFNIIF